MAHYARGSVIQCILQCNAEIQMLLLLNPNSVVVIRYSDTNLLLNVIMLVNYELKAYFRPD